MKSRLALAVPARCLPSNITGVTPDLLCCAKSLAGGLPMGAVLIGRNVQNLKPGVHGSTFGGNPLSCAAGLAAIGAIEKEQLPGQAAVKGAISDGSTS